jgi:acetyl esterase/lipase
MRSVLGSLSPRQLQYLAGTTKKNYLGYTKAHNVEPQEVTLPDGSKAFWIGSPNAKTIALYYHGGGWVMPGGNGHFAFVDSVRATAKDPNSIAFLVLWQKSSSDAKYPTQLRQSVELLRYATSSTGLNKDPKDIMLVGDSAGGNLVIAVLLHLLHPHPDIAPVELSAPLRAAAAWSPLVNFDLAGERFERNKYMDPTTPDTLRAWVRNYTANGSLPDMWADPGKVQSAEFKGLDHIVKDILVTAAQEEVMAENIAAMVNQIKVSLNPAARRSICQLLIGFGRLFTLILLSTLLQMTSMHNQI